MITTSARASEATPLEGLRRFPSDPAPPSAIEARELVKDWTSQEASPGYFPPDNSWPWPPESGNPRAAIPALRKALSTCGSASQSECHEVAFRLATALLGGLDGHVEADEVDERQRREGANLMRTLADSGSVDGACGWGYCLAEGEVVAEDQARAEHYYRQAARAGCEQAMHQLGVMHYLGDGTTTTGNDATGEAVRWFRMAAEHGISGSMYLLAECLLEGMGTQKDEGAALGWFAAAGELGHRSARSHIIRRTTDDNSKDAKLQSYADRFERAAGRQAGEWQALTAEV